MTGIRYTLHYFVITCCKSTVPITTRYNICRHFDDSLFATLCISNQSATCFRPKNVAIWSHELIESQVGNQVCDQVCDLDSVMEFGLYWTTLTSHEIKYLGWRFRGKQCAVDPSSFIGMFYGIFNDILNVMGNCRNELSALYLIQTYCLPSLLYSCETWSLSPCDEKRVDVAWNNAFRKIFNAYWHESVRPLQYYCSCLPVSILLPTKKLLFWKKMPCSGNLILCSVVTLVCLLWLLNTILNLMTLFVLVLPISRIVFGFICLN